MIEHEVPPRKSARDRWAKTRRRRAWPYVMRRALAAGLLFAILLLIADYLPLPGSHWHGVRSEVLRFIARAVFFGTVMGYFMWRRYRGDSTDSTHNSPSRLTNR